MLTQTLRKLFQQDLEKLKTEITFYTHEENLWKTEKNISNSAGNLCLHLIGNLNTYIGKELGRTGYIRNRPLEFSQKNIATSELLKMINETMIIIEKTLPKLTDEQLEADYPLIVFSEKMTTGFFLVHLISHLSYHLGQINYHRRMIDF